MLNPFTPGKSITVTVTASSAATALPATSSGQIRVVSPAANAVAFIAFGTSTVAVVIPTTATNGMPIPPGDVEVFTVPRDATHVAVIGTNSNTLYFTAGDGQ